VVYRTDDAGLAGILLGEPTFAELPDSSAIAGVRTAATTIVGTRALARPDSEVLGLIGTGKQAMAHLAAANAGMPPRKVVAFSRDHSKATAFAMEASQMFGLETTALESARAVIESSDVVITTTNSRHPVFDGSWLSPGQHVTSIVGGVARTGTSEKPGRRELDDETDRRAAVIAYTSLEQARIGFDDVTWETLPELSADGDPARPFGVRAIDLGDLLHGRVEGRRSTTDLTVFKNNAGQGVADLAIAALALTRARETGRGIRLNP
jgi:ornithine cyclodeaminase/alanine dehydrogenase-like protein (mu-crystallin family)